MARVSLVASPTAAQRVDKFLREFRFDGSIWFSRRSWTELVNKQCISTPEGRFLNSGDQCVPSDKIHIKFPQEISPDGIKLAKEAAKPVLSNQYFGVFDKPAGIHTYPQFPWDDTCFASRIASYLAASKIMSPAEFSLLGTPPILEGGLVQRLDFDTSGIIVCALDAATKSALRSAFHNGLVRKKYLTIVNGSPDKTGSVVFATWGEGVMRRAGATPPARAEAIQTVRMNVRVISSTEKHSLVEIDTQFGSRHVVRLGMQYLNSPVVGDGLYGATEVEKVAKKKTSLMIDRHFLHASQLQFSDTIITEKGVVIADTKTSVACKPPELFCTTAEALRLTF